MPQPFAPPPRVKNFADSIRDIVGEGWGLLPPGVRDLGPQLSEEALDWMKGRRRADGSPVPPTPRQRPLPPLEPSTDVDLREESGQGLPVSGNLSDGTSRLDSNPLPLGPEGSGEALLDAEAAAAEAYVERDSRRRRDPMAPRADDGLGEAEGYRGYEEYGSPGYGSQDNRPADEKAAGRERVQRTGGGYAHADELGFQNNPDGYTSEEQRLNAQVRSPDEREQDRISDQDAAAELRRSQRKPKYHPQTGQMLTDPTLERSGWQKQRGADGIERYRASDPQGVELQSRQDAREGLIRSDAGNVKVRMADGSVGWASDEQRDPSNGDGEYGQPVGGKQLGERQTGGTDHQREARMDRMAARRGVPIETIRKELASAEADGQVGQNSAEAWKGTLRKNRDAINSEARDRKERFMNQVKMGRRSEAQWSAAGELADIDDPVVKATRARMLGAPGADEGIAAGNVAAIKNLINQGFRGGGDDDPKLTALRLQKAQAEVDAAERANMTPAEIRVQKAGTATDTLGKARAYTGDSAAQWNQGFPYAVGSDLVRLREKIEADHPEATDAEKEAIYQHVLDQNNNWLGNSG